MPPIAWKGRNALSIDEESKTPKYLQIVTLVQRQISQGILQGGERIPSINETSEEYYLSRDTVEKAYKILKRQGTIVSVRGKGYYITDKLVEYKIRICLIFNKLSVYKKIIYDTIIRELGEKAQVDLYVHHCNAATFIDLLSRKLNTYDKYVIMPHFTTNSIDVELKLREIPPDKLIILDKYLPGFDQALGMVYQDFKQDIFEALEKATPHLKRYKELVLVYPEDTLYPFPYEIKIGFSAYCQRSGIPHQIITETGPMFSPKAGTAYVVIEESDLVNLIKNGRKLGWAAGTQFGILSYNETPIKEILEKGISVISTDFEAMGKQAARIILEGCPTHQRNPFRFISRSSL